MMDDWARIAELFKSEQLANQLVVDPAAALRTVGIFLTPIQAEQLRKKMWESKRGEWLRPARIRAGRSQSLTPDQLKSLTDSISKGGQVGMALAMYIATQIAEGESSTDNHRGK
jgi:hypothetical protein